MRGGSFSLVRFLFFFHWCCKSLQTAGGINWLLSLRMGGLKWFLSSCDRGGVFPLPPVLCELGYWSQLPHFGDDTVGKGWPWMGLYADGANWNWRFLRLRQGLAGRWIADVADSFSYLSSFFPFHTGLSSWFLTPSKNRVFFEGPHKSHALPML